MGRSDDAGGYLPCPTIPHIRFIVSHIPFLLINFLIPFHIRLSHVTINYSCINRTKSLITFLINSPIKRCYIHYKHVNIPIYIGRLFVILCLNCSINSSPATEHISPSSNVSSKLWTSSALYILSLLF